MVAPPLTEPTAADDRQLVADYVGYLLLDRFSVLVTARIRQRHIEDYLRYLRSRQTGPLEASEGDIAAYVRRNINKQLSANTVNLRITSVRLFHQYLLLDGRRADNPAVELRTVPALTKLPRVPTEDETARLIDGIRLDTPINYRDRAILEMLYGVGARASEVSSLDQNDLDLDAKLVTVTGKRSKQRILPIGKKAIQAVREWLDRKTQMKLRAGRSRQEPWALFNNQSGGRLSRQGVWLVVRRHAEEAGLGNSLSPHTLRHACATHMLNHGADIRALQELLGHASIVTTQIYTHVSPERLRKVYDEAHPRALTDSLASPSRVT